MKAFALVAGLVLAIASPALASTASVADGALSVVAAPGETNSVAVQRDGSDLLVSDAQLVAGDGCSRDADGARCPASGVTRIRLDLGDGDDVFYPPVDLPVEGNSGAGTDSFRARADQVAGSRDAGSTIDLSAVTGVERAFGAARADTLTGNTGANLLDPGTGPDTVEALAGNDHITLIDDTGVPDHGGHEIYEQWPDTVTCGRGRDVVQADFDDSFAADCEHVTVSDLVGGRPGFLVLNGDAHANRLHVERVIRGRLYGRGGADRLIGGERRDLLSGGPGADTIRSAGDGRRDVVHCGSGRDTVVADSPDRVGADCERVRRR